MAWTRFTECETTGEWGQGNLASNRDELDVLVIEMDPLYETWLGPYKVQKDAAVIITEHLLEMFGELAAHD